MHGDTDTTTQPNVVAEPPAEESKGDPSAEDFSALVSKYGPYDGLQA